MTSDFRPPAYTSKFVVRVDDETLVAFDRIGRELNFTSRNSFIAHLMQKTVADHFVSCSMLDPSILKDSLLRECHQYIEKRIKELFAMYGRKINANTFANKKK